MTVRPTLRLAAMAVVVSTSALMVLVPSPGHAGAFIFSGFANGLDVVTHPTGYDGSTASVTVSVCVHPDSVNKSAMETSVENVVHTVNELTPTTENLVFGEANNIPSDEVDFESVLLHEVGHCVGLAHVNLASESGLSGTDTNYTKSTDGTDDGDSFCGDDPGETDPCDYDIDDGADDIIGSGDDLRGDDDNLHWFRMSDNSPFTIAGTVDSTTYSRSLADLPGGDSYAANGDVLVADDAGFPNTEAVMQQGTRSDEAQRTLIPDGVATLRYGMSGVDEIAGTGDDYGVTLEYVGVTSECDVVIEMSDIGGLAFCQTRGEFIGPPGDEHVQITSADIFFDDDAVTWFFNDVSTVPCSVDENLDLSGQTITDTQTFEACDTITADTFTVASTGDVTFRAGNRIELEDGFAVESGGAFVAEIDPTID